MTNNVSMRGVCGIVECSACPKMIAGTCLGRLDRDAQIGGDESERCAIIACSQARGQDSCFDCDDFPCSIFRSPTSHYLPCETGNNLMNGCSVAAPPSNPADTPRKFISRFVTYLMVAEHHRRLGNETVTSAEFGSALGIKPPLVRKDLLSLGRFGIPHVGFKLDMCIEALRQTLNLETPRNIVWIGGNESDPPAQFVERLDSLGCRIVAILHDDEEGTPKRESIGAIKIFNFDEISRVIKNLAVVGAIVACANEHVQPVADTLFELGITSILNLTPVPLDHPPDTFVKNIDFSEDIILFSFYCGDR